MISFIIFVTLLINLNSGITCEGLSPTNLDFSSWDKVLRESVIVNSVDPSSGIGLNIFNYSNLVVSTNLQILTSLQPLY